MTSPLPIIAANWKMNKNIQATREFILRLLQQLAPPLHCEVAIFPPFTSLPAAAEMLAKSPFNLGAQDVHWEFAGAFTGEISPLFLSELGCRYCLVGHSERRQLFRETDEICNRKIKAVQAVGIRPILCCGEQLEERQAGQTIDVVKRQLVAGLANIESPNLDIAYEPVWSIGTGVTATAEQAAEVQHWIRQWLQKRFGTAADQIRILYGGSVKPDNAGALASRPEINGLLVGGASLDVNAFISIVNATQEAKLSIS